MSSQPKEGDRVRVTYEGEYVGSTWLRDGHAVKVKVGDNENYLATVPLGAVIEVLPKPIKVGDEIAPERVAELPYLSVVLSGRIPFIVRHDKRITGSSGAFYDPADDPRPLTVLHIPD